MEDFSINPTIQNLLRHASVRSFTEEPVSEKDIRAIFKAAQSASTSCFLQVTSIIRITDQAKKTELARLAGNQQHVAEAPEMWVFCADYHRNKTQFPDSELGWAEQLLVGVQDTGIMAQNAFVALESLGLGACYIGGIRNNIEAVSELLALPDHVFPLFGLAFGHPAKRNEVKPRMPAAVTFMENVYREPDPEVMKAYNETVERYYAGRDSNRKAVNWTRNMERYMKKERRPFILDFLHRKGWILR